MHVTITGVPIASDYTLNYTGAKIDALVLPFVQSLRDAYIKARMSDDDSATVDLVTDLLVYAVKAEGLDLDEFAERAVRAARGELFDAEHDEVTNDG